MISQRVKVSPRPGCKDIWNAFMVDGATFGKYDIPLCPTTKVSLYELDDRPATIEMVRRRDQMYDQISSEIDAEE